MNYIVYSKLYAHEVKCHVYRILSVPRTITSAALLAMALSFAGCKQAPPPPDDTALSSAVQSRISGDSALKSESIQATVQNGVATLNGSVSSDAARSLAAADASQVADLKTVVNNLTVQQPAPSPAAASVASPPVPTPAIEKKPVATKKPVVKTHPERVEHSPAPIERVPPPDERAQAEPPPPAAPAFRDLTILAGATIPVNITQTLDSATAQEGDTFSGTVASDIVIDGLVAIPQGATVSGRVEAVQEAAHFKGNSLLTVAVTRLNRRGESVAISTEPYTVAGKGRGKNTAEKVGGGAAVGAILGGIFGGGKGAAIGAATGGGLGAGANAITKGQQVQIPSESLVRFRLTNSLAVRVAANHTRSTSNNPNLQQRSNSEPQ